MLIVLQHYRDLRVFQMQEIIDFYRLILCLATVLKVFVNSDSASKSQQSNSHSC